MKRALYPKEKYPSGHPDLALSINNLAVLHKDAGEYGKALPLFHEALDMRRALFPKDRFPDGHPALAQSINNLASLHQDAGEYGKAEPLYKEALDMRRALYPRDRFPNGHPALALSLNNLATLQLYAREYGKAEPLYREALDMRRALFPKERFPNGHPDIAESINNLAALHSSAGEYGKAGPLYREALDMKRALYPKEKYPSGHPDLAQSINNLATLHLYTREYGKAEPLYREALDMKRALYPRERFPNGHPDIAQGIKNLAGLHQDAGEYGKAEPLYKAALDMRRALYPKGQYPQGHPALAASITNMATLHASVREYAKAEPLCREALHMYRALYPNGHLDLAITINNLASLHLAAGEYGKAEPLYREALDMYRALFPKDRFPHGDPDLAASLSNLADLHKATGEYGKAEPLYHEALDMWRALYPRGRFPNGHPDIARSIDIVADLHGAAREYGEAEHYCREALDMRRALFPRERFPNGHTDIAQSINNVAFWHHAAGEYGKAEPLYREALDMHRALFPRDRFPDGHPDLATSINNLATLHGDAGEYGKAEPLYKEALDMLRAQFPKGRFPHGHPDLAASLSNLAGLHAEAGEYGKAEPLCREALDMYRDLLLQYAELAAEAECLNYLQTRPLALDGFLSATRLPAPSAAAYDVLWDSRAAITRLMQARHRDLMAGRDQDTRDLAEELYRARLTLERRLLHPLPDADLQRKEVQTLTDTKEDLEKRIARTLKLAAAAPATTPPLKRLLNGLPDRTAFVDLYRYTRLEQSTEIRGKKGVKRTACYVAFVVRRGRPVARVELNEAAPIDRAWAAWRRAITADRPDEAAERQAAAALAKLVWEPLRRELPADLRTVYLTPDGALHQVPWGALPGRKADTVLLDDHALCLVPHGPFLLGRLEDGQPAAPPGGTLLAVGGVDYDGTPAGVAARGGEFALREAAVGPKGVRWPALGGTERERQQVAALARRAAKLDVVERSGKGAGTEQLQRDLPQARYAHLATHGFFAGPEFRSALQLDPKLFARASKDRRSAARSPLALSGLVLAGANRAGQDMADDRGIVTAEGLIGLRLEGMELAVLSACETGLGDYGGGEGVYGLQRAFHVAGCRNVVASLLKVDDGATQALMALFYRNLWERKLDPAEALRQAQLTLYRHPEAVAEAKKRGVDFSESDLPRLQEKPADKPSRSPTAHWAAFTFSGIRPPEGKPEQK
jgi:CHAT domain-containing protein